MQGGGQQSKEDKAGQERQSSRALPEAHVSGSQRKRSRPGTPGLEAGRALHLINTSGAPTVYTTYAYEAPPASSGLGFSSKKGRCDPRRGSLSGGGTDRICFAERKLAALPRMNCTYILPNLHVRNFGLRRMTILAPAKGSDY